MPYHTLRRRVGNTIRLTEVIGVLLRHGLEDLLRRMRVHEGMPANLLRKLRIMHPAEEPPATTGAQLRAAFTELGPTFVKLGQVLSTRPDIVGKEIARDLNALTDRVQAKPFGEIRPIIEKGIEGCIEEKFLEFNETPIAAASLSQVYRAKLRDGTPVVVKVQRPGARQHIETDLRFLQGLAEWLSEHVEEAAAFDPEGVLDEFRRSVRRELDFSLEGHMIERFRTNYDGDATVFVPKVYLGLTSANVLTMDYVDGVRIDALDKYPERGSDPKEVAARGCRTLCRQVFEFRLFHADPHPGNIMLTRGNTIAFLDYGMLGHLEKDDVKAIADLLFAVFQEDPSMCVQAAAAFTSTGEIPDPEALEHDIAEQVTFQASVIIGKGQVGDAIDLIVGLLRKHKLQLAPRFSLLLKALATIESTGHVLDQDLDMVPIIRPYVERVVADRYSLLHITRGFRKELHSFLQLARQLPNDARQILRLLRRGKFQINMRHENLENLAAVLDTASNRITVGLITAAVIVGSSILVSTGGAMQHVGIGGYLVAGVLGLYIVVSILKSKNY